MTKQPRLTGKALLMDLLKDPERKPLFQIGFEIVFLWLTYWELPKHYLTRYLFKKGVTNIKDYLPNKLLDNKIPVKFNDQKVKEVLDNKLYFDLFYRQFNTSLPKILMYNHRRVFISGDRRIEVNNISDFKLLAKEIFHQNTSYDSVMIKKTYSSSSGNKIFKLTQHQFDKDPETLQEIYNEVINSDFMFQETVLQHNVLNRLNPSSLNTIRLDTFINAEGKADIISAHIRMSMNNHYVDNIGSGGCAVGIDIQTGRLKKFGYSSIKNNGVKVLTEHPVTKTVFEGLVVPFFSQAKELAIQVAGFMPELRLIGWDVSIGKSGPVLIEGNSNYQVSGSDFLAGGYLSNPNFRKVLQEMNYF